MARLGRFLELTADFGIIQVRQVGIEENYIGLLGVSLAEAFGTVGGRDDLNISVDKIYLQDVF
jgi:hypothetical protein